MYYYIIAAEVQPASSLMRTFFKRTKLHTQLSRTLLLCPPLATPHFFPASKSRFCRQRRGVNRTQTLETLLLLQYRRLCRHGRNNKTPNQEDESKATDRPGQQKGQHQGRQDEVKGRRSARSAGKGCFCQHQGINRFFVTFRQHPRGMNNS